MTCVEGDSFPSQERTVPRRLSLLLIALTTACTPATKDDATRGEFGVFFGGQLQERKDIPFNLATKAGVPGFRVHFPNGSGRSTVVHWELSKPDPAPDKATLPKVSKRRTQLGQKRVEAGTRVFDQQLPLQPGDPLGLWNIRVTTGTKLVLDRPFQVVSPRTLARSKRLESPQVDGGFL